VDFVLSVRQLTFEEAEQRSAASLPTQHAPYESGARASHEVRRLRSKLLMQRAICDAFAKQYEETIQLVGVTTFVRYSID
jgi:hypothetical protein